MKLLISACLLGEACRYDGGSKALPGLDSLRQRFELVPACPEQLGGLPTPRPPSEIRGGLVIDSEGRDKTAQFRLGAGRTLELCLQAGCRQALLKARSPSCGKGQVYDGSFTGRLVAGHGFTAALLLREGIEVFTEDETGALLAAASDETANGGQA